MGCQHIGQATDFTSAHRIWLAGHREWGCTELTNFTREQMAVNNTVGFIYAMGGLVYTHGEQRHDFVNLGKFFKELTQLSS